MTEDEAKTKWCPQRVKGSSPGLQTAEACSCIASACMAWRWDGTHVNDPADPKADLIWSNRSYGHCGLAGDVTPERAISLESRT